MSSGVDTRVGSGSGVMGCPGLAFGLVWDWVFVGVPSSIFVSICGWLLDGPFMVFPLCVWFIYVGFA